MMTTVLGEDDQPFSLVSVKRLLLEDKDPTEYGIWEACRIAYQILFSNNVDEFQKLLQAIVTFDSAWARTHSKYESLGLNCMGVVPEMFYEAHPKYQRPTNIAVKLFDHTRQEIKYWKTIFSSKAYSDQLLANYPDIKFDHNDSHQWKHTDDPVVISYCCHKLASNPDEESPPTRDDAKEALEAAQKLYEQPQSHPSKIVFANQIIHHAFISRDLSLKLAIYLEDFQTALEILRLAIKVDTFWQYKSEVFLRIPGIYNVLPLLAAEGLQANPYHVSPENAKVIVSDLKEAMEGRIAKGQLVPMERVSWKDLLRRLSKAAWEVNETNYRKHGLTKSDDVLFPPATKEQIEIAEKRVGKLPNDLKEMVKIANGFKGGWHFLSGGMAGVTNISAGPEIAEWSDILEETDLRTDGCESGNMIQIQPGAECDGFTHYLIPPAVWKKNVVDRKVKNNEYLYFPVTSWDDSRETHTSVREYIVSCVRELEEMVANGQREEEEDGTGGGGESEEDTETADQSDRDSDGDSQMTDVED